MADEDDRAVMADAVQEAVSALYPGSFVTRWITLVEIVEPDGERALSLLAQKGMKAWETLGMLEYVRQVEQAATIRSEDDGG